MFITDKNQGEGIPCKGEIQEQEKHLPNSWFVKITDCKQKSLIGKIVEIVDYKENFELKPKKEIFFFALSGVYTNTKWLKDGGGTSGFGCKIN